MKTAIFFCATILAFLPTTPLSAQTLTVGTVPAYAGQAISVPIFLSQPANIVAAQFDLTYDSTKLIPLIALLPQTSGRTTVASRELGPGRIRIVAYSLSSLTLSDDAAITRIPFTLAPLLTDLSVPIAASNVRFSRSDGTLVTADSQFGAVFTRLLRLDSGYAQFILASQPGETYRVEATMDFKLWSVISTARAASDFLFATDTNAFLFSRRFYRLQLQPAQP